MGRNAVGTATTRCVIGGYVSSSGWARSIVNEGDLGAGREAPTFRARFGHVRPLDAGRNRLQLAAISRSEWDHAAAAVHVIRQIARACLMLRTEVVVPGNRGLAQLGRMIDASDQWRAPEPLRRPILRAGLSIPRQSPAFAPRI